ncbi:MAG: hypothetical protein NTZ56_15715 [Acidobacteria bacterium]|nr:hypothetical protein [Acidobacteriota bacterium]
MLFSAFGTPSSKRGGRPIQPDEFKLQIVVNFEFRRHTMMESLRNSAIWERSASANLWLRTLAQIPSLFGRLVYLSSLRDANSDAYQHHGLAMVFGEAEADQALRESHEKAFADWLMYGLEQQKADLDLFLSTLDTPKRLLLESWQRLTPYKNLIPSRAGSAQESLYLADLETLLRLLRNEYGAAPHPAASRHR